MEKTIKQIADELKIEKQKVYRYIKKNCINEAHQKNGVMYYNEAVQERIKQAFSSKTQNQRSTSNEALYDVLLKQSEMLKNELEVKNKQISELQERLAECQKLLDQQQQLHALTEKKIELLEQKTEETPQSKKKWRFW